MKEKRRERQRGKEKREKWWLGFRSERRKGEKKRTCGREREERETLLQPETPWLFAVREEEGKG